MQRDDAQDRGDEFVGFGDDHTVVGHFLDDVISLADDGYDLSFPRLYFLDIADDFFVVGVFCGYEDNRQVFVHEGDGAVFHFGGGVSFCVDVADLFQL